MNICRDYDSALQTMKIDSLKLCLSFAKKCLKVKIKKKLFPLLIKQTKQSMKILFMFWSLGHMWQLFR